MGTLKPQGKSKLVGRVGGVVTNLKDNGNGWVVSPKQNIQTPIIMMSTQCVHQNVTQCILNTWRFSCVEKKRHDIFFKRKCKIC